jgi:hypothetical protein
MNVVVAQNGGGAKVIALMHHDPAGQNADRSFEDAHVDVHLEEVYIFAPEQGRGKGDDRGVVGADKFFHGLGLKDKDAAMSSDLEKVSHGVG